MDNDASNTPAEVSDKSFYLIMLAMIVGMGLYVSYDMEQRYGSDNNVAGSKVTTDGSDRSAEGSENTADASSTAEVSNIAKSSGAAEGSGAAERSSSAEGSSTTEGSVSAEGSGSTEGSTAIVENKPAQSSEPLAPVIVSIEKVKSDDVKPVAEISAIETSSEAVVIEKTEQVTSVTTAVAAVEKAPVEDKKAEHAAEQPPAAAEAASVVAIPARAPVTVEDVPGKVEDSANQAAEVIPVMPAVSENQQVTEVVAAPVVKDVVEQSDADTAVSSEAISATQPAQEYNTYNYPSGRSYGGNPYPPQRPYRSSYRSSYRDNYYPAQRPYNNPNRRSYQNKPYSRQSPYTDPYSNNRYSRNQYRSNPYGYDYNSYQQPATSVE